MSKLLLITKGVLMLDVNVAASTIDIEPIKHLIKNDSKSLFNGDKITPILKDTVKYWYLTPSGFVQFHNLHEVIDKRVDVYEIKGGVEVLVLKASSILYYGNNLTIGPSYQAMIAMTIVVIILTTIEQRCSYSRFGSIVNTFEGYYGTVETTDYIEDHISTLIEMTYNFIQDSAWNIFFKKIEYNSLIIEKSIDFRIYDWHRLQDNEN